jgi:hypothetical protein
MFQKANFTLKAADITDLGNALFIYRWWNNPSLGPSSVSFNLSKKETSNDYQDRPSNYLKPERHFHRCLTGIGMQ